MSQTDDLAFLGRGGGGTSATLRAIAWEKTSLGAPASWPSELRTLLQVVLSARQAMLLTWGPERTMLYNDAYAVLCGGKHPWALGKPFATVWPEVIDKLGPIMEAAYAGMPATVDDMHFVLKRNGYPEEAYFSFGYTPVRDSSSGEVVGMLCVCVETTVEARSARETRNEIERLAAMFRQAPGAMALLRGPQHVFEIVNAAYLQLIGHRSVEGKPVARALPEVVGQAFIDLLDRVYSTGEPFIGHAMPAMLQRMPGAPVEERLLDFVYQPVRGPTGMTSGIFVQATDVTERVRAEEALRNGAERLELALSAGGGVGSWDWDIPADRLTADARFAALYGIDPKRLEEGVPLDAMSGSVHPEDAPRVRAEIGETLATGQDFLTEFRVVVPGGLHWVAAQGRCVFDENGKPLHFPGVSFDITARKRSEEEVRTARDERDFVISLSEAQRSLPSPEAIMERTSQRLAARLGVGRVGFYTVKNDTLFTYGPNWTDETLPRLSGTEDVSALGPDYSRTLADGEAFVFHDREAEAERVALPRMRRLGTGAGINVPLVRGGVWEAGLYVSSAVPRRWSEDEVALVREVAQLSWAAVERARAEAVLRRRAALSLLDDRLRDLSEPADIAYAGAELLGTTLGVSRAGYGTIDPVRETITVERDWNAPGIKTIAGTLHFRDHGSYIDDLKRGETAIVTDARSDPRTADTAAVLEEISARSFVNMPLTENGAFVALLYLNHASPRIYSTDDIALMREVAERTRAAVERRRAQAELTALTVLLEEKIAERTAERNLLATVLETTDAFVQVADLDYRWLAINKASADEFERIFGIRPKVGESMLDLLASKPEHREEVRAVWGRALAGEEFVEVQSFGDPALDRRFYEMKFNPLLDRAGNRIGAYQFVHDVTERLRAQDRLVEAEEQVRQMQKMEAVGQLTGGIAHDFNNMMAVVIGGLNLLQRRLARGDTDVGRFIEGAMDGANRAAALTQRLLAFSRQQPLAPEAIDANAMLEGMTEMLTRTLGDNIRVQTVLQPELWRSRADPSQLENAILNLCVNARDAMPEGGQLTVLTTNVALWGEEAEQEGVEPGEYVRLDVTDTGTGMSADVIEKAFDPFFTTKGVGKGTGLGLSQVFGFIRQSGGQVKILSELGTGTTVSVFLPRFEGSAPLPSARPREGLPEGAGSDEIVMVVEDEERVRQFSSEALRELGYRVVETRNATEALRMIEAGEPVSLVFTDIMMPDMTGRQLAELALKARPGLRVLFTTAYIRDSLMDGGIFDRGANILSKPFSIEQLATKVREVLDAD